MCAPCPRSVHRHSAGEAACVLPEARGSQQPHVYQAATLRFFARLIFAPLLIPHGNV